MKKFKKILILFGILACGGLFYSASAQNISSMNYRYNNVPNYYYANYRFINKWNDIRDVFSTIKARNDLGLDVDTTYFQRLYGDFVDSFGHLTRDFQTIYEKCNALALELSHGITYMNLQAFLGNSCYKGLSSAASTINSKYTVRVSASSNPSQGLAPLTVTFDARGSSDPSSETIPTDNFYWYYRDENGVDNPIGQGQVVTYTFQEAGKFIVHLVVRSSNVDAGILDGEKDITINVQPKAANIVVYANTRRMDSNTPLKIGITEGMRGVVFDGSATMPRGGRKIRSHTWTIRNSAIGFSYSKSGEGSPSYINVPLEGNGEFKITLTTKDNENNTVSETFNLYISDPVALIKQTPERGTTSSTFNFDGSASYSITNRLDTYLWEIFNENGDKIKMEQGKKMSKIFTKPGNYLIRLTTTDINGNSNVDIKELYIESTIPTPQFTITPTSKWKYPSEFTLDASSSSDIDVLNGVDSLEYERKFDTENYSVISTENDNQRIVVQFNETGKHTIKLIVRDAYDKNSTISKTIDVKSVLRPEIEAIPGAIERSKEMSFKSSVNNPVINYVWSFGDGTNDKDGQKLINTEHTYNKAGVYNVTLTVYDMQGDSNTVTEKVFIGEIGYPIAAYKVKDSKGFYVQASDSCKIVGEGGSNNAEEAYSIDRYKSFTIDPSFSVNTKGNQNGLQYVFEKESLVGESHATTNKTQYSDSFNMVGCHYIDLTVHDSNIGKQDKLRIRFNVKNATPTVSNVTLSFPQYSDNNNTQVGFPTSATTNTTTVPFDCSGTNNLTVKVTAVNAADSDGSISRLQFYYYNADNPDRILERKEARITAPYVYFIVPRVTGEYKFGVIVYDNDGGKVDSKDLIGSNPSVYFPASCDSSDIPTVALRVSSQSVQVGDNVTYSIVSRIGSIDENFEVERTFYYDFEGDGVWDSVTKQDTVTYTFTEPHEEGITPRAAVEYRGKMGVGDGATIIVRNGTKPVLLHNSYKNIVLFRDMSIGTFQQRQICFETDECQKGNTKFQRTNIITTGIDTLTGGTETSITKNDSFLWKYEDFGLHHVSLYLKNKYGISVETGFTIKTSSNTSNGHIAAGVNMITIPETTFNNSNPEIFLSRVMKNTLLMYINYENEGACYVDTDISTDSNGDGETDNDMDIMCNTIAKVLYQPDYESAIGRIYFTVDNQLMYKNFYVSFEGYILELDEEKLEIYNDITTLINGIEDISIGNVDLKNYLDNLRKNLNSTNMSSSLVVAIQELLNDGGVKITASQKDILDSVISRLSNGDTIIAVGMNEFEKNKLEILAILPSSLRPEIEGMFSDFELNISAYDPEKKAQELKNIRNVIIEEGQSMGGLDDKDIALVIQPSFCNIFSYYDITRYSSSCGTDDTITSNWIDGEQGNSTSSSNEKKGLPKPLKIIIVCLISGLLIVGGVIVFFSVKAKLNSNSEEDEEG